EGRRPVRPLGDRRPRARLRAWQKVIGTPRAGTACGRPNLSGRAVPGIVPRPGVSGRKLSGERRADLGVDTLLEAGSPLDDPRVVERQDLCEERAGNSRSPVNPVVAVEQACPVARSSPAHPWDVLEDEMEAQPEALGDWQGGHVVAKLGDHRAHDLRQNHTGELVAERKLDGLGPQYSLAVELLAAL